MAKLAFLLALAQTNFIYGLPTREKELVEALDERAITLSSNLPVTTSYISTVETFQSASETVSPSVTGVRLLFFRLSWFSKSSRAMYVFFANAFHCRPSSLGFPLESLVILSLHPSPNQSDPSHLSTRPSPLVPHQQEMLLQIFSCRWHQMLLHHRSLVATTMR